LSPYHNSSLYTQCQTTVHTPDLVSVSQLVALHTVPNNSPHTRPCLRITTRRSTHSAKQQSTHPTLSMSTPYHNSSLLYWTLQYTRMIVYSPPGINETHRVERDLTNQSIVRNHHCNGTEQHLDTYDTNTETYIHTYSFRQRSFTYCDPKTWNDIPLPVKQSPSLDSFKHNLKTRYFANNWPPGDCLWFDILH